MLRGKWYLEGAKSIASRLQILMWPCCDSSAYFLAFRILHETPNWCGYSSWRQLACVWVCDAICRERMQLTTCRCLQAVVDTSLVNPQVQTPSQVILSSDWRFSLVLVNWHCFLVQFCRWLAHAFSLIAEPDGPSCPRHLRWSMRKTNLLRKAFAFRNVPSILRSLAAQTDCEILQCRRQAVQPSHPPQHLSNRFHFTAVTALNVPETAAPVLEHFPDWYWGFLLWQRHAIVCTCLQIWYLAASVGIPHKD